MGEHTQPCHRWRTVGRTTRASFVRRLGCVCMGLLLGLVLSSGAAHADSLLVCMQKIPLIVQPSCSFKAMVRSVNTDYMPEGALIRPYTYYAPLPGSGGGELRQHPPPGQAHLVFSGIVTAGGAACVQHVSRRMISGISNKAAVAGTYLQHMGMSPSMLDKKNVEKLQALGRRMGQDQRATGKINMTDMAQAMKMMFGGPRAPDNGANEKNEQVVFSVFSPNLYTAERGLLMPAGGDGPYKTIGSWGEHAAGYLVITLPGVHPSELRAGKTYRAEAFSGGGHHVNPAALSAAPTLAAFYTSAEGTVTRVPMERDEAVHAASICVQTHLASMAQQAKGTHGLGALMANLCAGRGGVAFQGVNRIVGGRLSGTVTIRRITNAKVIGTFHLNGQARVKVSRFEYTYYYAHDSKGHRVGGMTMEQLRKAGATALGIDGSTQVETHAESGPLKASGSFEAPNTRGYGPVPGGMPAMLMAAHIPPSGKKFPKRKKLLHLVARQPADHEYNVNWSADEQRLVLRFDHPVDLASITSNSVYLEWADHDLQIHKIPLEVESVGNDGKIVVLTHPGVDLKDGVRYRVRVKSGPNGVHGTRGEPLDSDYKWNFYTMIDFKHRHKVIPGLEKILDPHEGIEAHVFQVARDTDLILRKPTLTRVYVKWKERKDVATNWQVMKFPAIVLVHANAEDGPLLYRGKDVWIKRPDRYGDTKPDLTPYKRFARNSVNFFNWRPSNSNQPTQLIAEVKPIVQCDTKEHRFYSNPKPLHYVSTNRIPVLLYSYYLVKYSKSSWAKKVPVAYAANAQYIMHEGMRFTEQNFPIVHAWATYGGTIDADAGWFAHVSKNKLMAWQWKQMIWNYPANIIAKKVYARMGNGTHLLDADVHVLFMPKELNYGAAGYTYEAYKGLGRPGEIAIWLGDTHLSYHIVDVAHETGHVFGLVHSNRELEGPPRWYMTKLDKKSACSGAKPPPPTPMPIEGFRISNNGSSGTNKSATEGNGNLGGTHMYALMSCGQTPPEGTFITNSNYKKLLGSSGLFTANSEPFSNYVLVASNGPVAAPSVDYWVVSGLAKRDGRAALITGVESVSREKAVAPGTGKFEMTLKDGQGQTLVSRHFVPRPSPTTPNAPVGSFSVILPQRPSAKEIIIRYRGKVIQRYVRSAHPPTLSNVKARRNAQGAITISWQGQDVDGDKLTYDSYYSPNGIDFYLRGVGLRRDHLVLSARDTFPGDNPEVRVIASDGFDQVSDTISLPWHGPLNLLVTLPKDGGERTEGDAIDAAFNADLAPDAINDQTFVLTDADGKKVPATVEYRSVDYTATLTPKKPLKSGMRYTATLSSGISDRYGDKLGKSVTWHFVQQAPPGASAPVSAIGKPMPEHSESRASGRGANGGKSSASSSRPNEPSQATATLAGSLPSGMLGAGAFGTGSSMPDGMMPDMRVLSRAAPDTGTSPGGRGSTDEVRGGHGHLRFGNTERDFKIDSCSFQNVPGMGQQVSVQANASDLRVMISSASTGPDGKVQTVAIVLGTPPSVKSFQLSRTEQGGTWRSASGWSADGPAVRVDGRHVSVHGTFSETSVGIQREVGGSIEAVCGG